MEKRLKLSLMGLENKVFAVALSGGRDSVALLHLFKKADSKFFAVNVEHGIRGEKSIEDSEFCKTLCKKLGVECLTFSVDAPKFAQENKLSLEQAARLLRYEIFDSLVKEGKCDYVVLGHHADDQAETVLMRIFRGTGIQGIRGMQTLNGVYFRPLLQFSREDINSYVFENGLEYVEDETNADTAYTRNFIRCEIASIKERYPRFVSSILRLARNADETENFINQFVKEPTYEDGIWLVKFEEVNQAAIFKRAVLKAAAKLGVTQDIEERHFELIKQLKSSDNGAELSLPHGLICAKQADGYGFYIKKEKLERQQFAFDFDSLEKIGVTSTKVEQNVCFEKGLLYVDVDKISDDAVIRRRQDGDYILKFGGGTKSLGDFLTDIKYPKRNRDDLWVLAVGSEILVIFGVEISRNVAIDKNSKNIYKFK